MMAFLGLAGLGAKLAGIKGQLIFGAVVAAGAVAFCFGLIQWGRNIERTACDSKAKDAIIEGLQRDLNLANDRAGRVREVEDELRDMRKQSDDRIAALQKEVDDERKRADAAKPGDAPSPTALVDRNCNYTPHGVKRLRK